MRRGGTARGAAKRPRETGASFARRLVNAQQQRVGERLRERLDFVGEAVSVVEYNHRMTGTVNFTFLADTDAEAVEAAIIAWATKVATAAPYGLAAGGSAVVSDLKITEANEEARTGSCTVTYYPQAQASA